VAADGRCRPERASVPPRVRPFTHPITLFTRCLPQGLPLAPVRPQNLLFTPDGACTDGQPRRTPLRIVLIVAAVLVAIVFAFVGQLYFAYFLGIVAIVPVAIMRFARSRTPTD
jgi:hypothetical protein